MLGEIDRDHYCSADSYAGDGVCAVCFLDDENDGDDLCHKICKNHHRKWPTTQQFFDEYGEKYPDDGAVYCFNPRQNEWQADWLSSMNRFNDECRNEGEDKWLIVCACAPFGKPPKEWRP